MSAGRFRAPKAERPLVGLRPLTKAERAHWTRHGVTDWRPQHAAEPLGPPVLRRSRRGLVNVRQPQQAAIRRDLKRKRAAADRAEAR